MLGIFAGPQEKHVIFLQAYSYYQMYKNTAAIWISTNSSISQLRCLLIFLQKIFVSVSHMIRCVWLRCICMRDARQSGKEMVLSTQDVAR